MSGFSNVTYPRARAAYPCCECHLGIAKGDVYARIAGASDGRAWAVKMCRRCEALNDYAWGLVTGHEEDGPCFGYLVDWLEEYELPKVLVQQMEPAVAGHFLGLLFSLKERREAAKMLRKTGPCAAVASG